MLTVNLVAYWRSIGLISHCHLCPDSMPTGNSRSGGEGSCEMFSTLRRTLGIFPVEFTKTCLIVGSQLKENEDSDEGSFSAESDEQENTDKCEDDQSYSGDDSEENMESDDQQENDEEDSNEDDGSSGNLRTMALVWLWENVFGANEYHHMIQVLDLSCSLQMTRMIAMRMRTVTRIRLTKDLVKRAHQKVSVLLC